MDLLCLFICALWSPAGKGLTSWLSFVVSNCEFVTFPLVSWPQGQCLIMQFLSMHLLLNHGMLQHHTVLVHKSHDVEGTGQHFV